MKEYNFLTFSYIVVIFSKIGHPNNNKARLEGHYGQTMVIIKWCRCFNSWVH